MKTPLALLCVAALATNLSAQTPAPAAATPAPAYVEPPPPVPLSPTVVAHLAKLKPIFDGKTLDGWIQAPVAPIRFAGEDQKDFPAFAKKLAEKSDPVAAFLAAQLDDAGRAALASYAPTADAKVNAPHVSAIMRNVNRLVGDKASLYDEARFKGVALRAETDALRRKNPSGPDLARLNRLLLEDAFPAEFARSPAAAWSVKDGALASTGAGRGVIYTQADYAHYRLVFQVRQISGNHVPGVLVFCARPPAGELGLDALGAVQFQVPNGGHWDYRPGINKAGEHFTRPIRIRYNLKEWAQVEILVNAQTGIARMAVAQPVGSRGIENLVFNDSAAGKPGPIALQMHNALLFDEYRDLKIEVDPKEERLLTVE